METEITMNKLIPKIRGHKYHCLTCQQDFHLLDMPKHKGHWVRDKFLVVKEEWIIGKKKFKITKVMVKDLESLLTIQLHGFEKKRS